MSRRKIIEVDPCEIACLIAEAMHGIPRPAGLTAEQALDLCDPETKAALLGAAKAAAGYLIQKVNGQLLEVN